MVPSNIFDQRPDTQMISSPLPALKKLVSVLIRFSIFTYLAHTGAFNHATSQQEKFTT